MKTVEITIGGTPHRMALSGYAAMRLLEKYESMAEVLDALRTSDPQRVHAELPEILSALLEGGAAYARLTGEAAEKPPATEAILMLMSEGELLNARNEALRAVMAGMIRTVEVEPDRKNVGATQGG